MGVRDRKAWKQKKDEILGCMFRKLYVNIGFSHLEKAFLDNRQYQVDTRNSEAHLSRRYFSNKFSSQGHRQKLENKKIVLLRSQV